MIVDENECEEGTAECNENAECTNNEGSYLCECTKGYRGDGFQCEGVHNKNVYEGGKIRVPLFKIRYFLITLFTHNIPVSWLAGIIF